MAKASYRSTQYRINRRLLLADHPNCWLCGGPGADTADHIIPVSKGGTADRSNLRPAHQRCNASRGDRGRIRYTAGW